MNSLTLTIKTEPLIFLHFSLKFIIKKPVQFVSLLFIFLRFMTMNTSFLNLQKGRHLIKKANNLSLWHPSHHKLTLIQTLPGREWAQRYRSPAIMKRFYMSLFFSLFVFSFNMQHLCFQGVLEKIQPAPGRSTAQRGHWVHTPGHTAGLELLSHLPSCVTSGTVLTLLCLSPFVYTMEW